MTRRIAALGVKRPNDRMIARRLWVRDLWVHLTDREIAEFLRESKSTIRGDRYYAMGFNKYCNDQFIRPSLTLNG